MKSAIKLELASDIKLPDEILIGKDILELVSGAMYVDPLNLYREYVQNATDSIDQITSPADAQIDIRLDPASRSITIRDNGAGLSNADFPAIMTAVGGSKKRVIPGSRGFRGVGRFAGLGYCRSLSFRSKAENDKSALQITWDCVQFKRILRDATYAGNLQDVIRKVSTVTSTSADGDPPFFEVKLDGVIRLKNDILLNDPAVANYLSQVAPVPFHPEFGFADEIETRLIAYGINPGYTITLAEVHLLELEPRTIFRPHANQFTGATSKIDSIDSIQHFDLPGIEGDVAAIGWVADTSYYGAIPPSELIKGIRFRVGNLQVGEPDIVAAAFPETRFNSWSIGEIHVLSSKVLPNGRRDNFEDNAHFENLISQLQPHLKNIAQICRTKSSRRQWTIRFTSKMNAVEQDLSFLESGSLNKPKSAAAIKSVERGILELEETIINSTYDWVKSFRSDLKPLKSKLTRISKRVLSPNGDPFSAVPYGKRLAFQEILEMIYEVSNNKEATNIMIDKVVKRIATRYR